MTGTVAILPLLASLVACAGTLLLRRWPRVQRLGSVLGAVVYAVSVGILAWTVVFAPDGGAIAYQIGGWRAPFGITVVADALAAFMLAIAALLAVFAAAFSVRYIDYENQQVFYHPLFHFLLLGTTGAFLTGDLFNLFVWFEVILMASYVFVAFYGDAKHTAAAVRYVVLNIVGGVVMLLSIGGLYATLGTLNMAEMAVQLQAGGTEMAPVVGFSGLLLATFAMKAGLVPFQFWVPAAYRAAPLPIVALFAAVTKKVGIYAVLRVYFTVFSDASLGTAGGAVTVDTLLAFLSPLLLVMGAASILVGGVGAVTRPELEGLLAYSSIGQVGFIATAIGIAAGTPSASLRHLGVLAALVFTLHHAVTKGMLFLAAGVVQDGFGTTRLSRLGGIGDHSSSFAGVFLVGGLSLVGIPPLAGFFGKLFVFETAVTEFAASTGEAAAALTVGLVLFIGAVLTILYVTRLWVGSFWGAQTDTVLAGDIDGSQVAILAVMATVVVAVGVGFEPVSGFADAAADAALDTDGYIELVLGGDGG
jgi:multicomponent Na+:H+ antiporter subunit D